MLPTFNDLELQLGLTPEYLSPEQLNGLQDWCEKNVSTDIISAGKPEEIYKQYRKLAQSYLDDFIALIPDDIKKIPAEFEEMNAIQYAAYKGYDKYLAANKSFGAAVFNEPTKYGMTPLHLAGLKGHVQTIKTLLSSGATPTTANNNKQFPVYTCLVLVISDKPEVKKRKTEIYHLLAKQAEFALNAVDSSGETIVHLMSVNGYDDLINDVLKKNPKLAFQRNNFSRYPIHSAILNGQVKAVEVLIKIDGMSEVKDKDNRNPLHFAARNSGGAILQACIKASKNIDALDSSHKTALMLAAEAGKQESVQLLIKAGAKSDSVDATIPTLK